MFEIVILGVLGAVFGSFLTAFTFRLHDGRDWVKGRSECDSCNKPLSAISLVPVLSWVWQNGKCRECSAKISWTYPATELSTAGAFIGSYLAWPYGYGGIDGVRFGVWICVLIGFIAMSLYDLRWLIIPNKIVYPLIVLVSVFVGVEAVFYGGGADLVRGAVLGLVSVGGLFYALYQVSGGRWIGGGDVKLGFLIGLLVAGFLKGLLVVMLASFIGLLFVMPALLLRKVKPKGEIPFGPALMVAASIVFMYGDQFLDWYIGDLVLL